MPPIERKARTVTDLTLRSWLNAGPVDRSVGNSLIFVAPEASSRSGRASWIRPCVAHDHPHILEVFDPGIAGGMCEGKTPCHAPP